jgi:hypothetical protein
VAINVPNPGRYNGKSFHVTRRNLANQMKLLMVVDVQHAKEASKQEGRDD